MQKYRINKGIHGFNVFLMHDEGNGWSKEFVSNHDTRAQAEKAVERLKTYESEQKILQEKG